MRGGKESSKTGLRFFGVWLIEGFISKGVSLFFFTFLVNSGICRNYFRSFLCRVLVFPSWI